MVYIATTWLSAANFVANVGGINLHAGVLLPKHLFVPLLRHHMSCSLQTLFCDEPTWINSSNERNDDIQIQSCIWRIVFTVTLHEPLCIVVPDQLIWRMLQGEENHAGPYDGTLWSDCGDCRL